MPRRRILHLDMDAFFASVEQRDDPALRGRPVLVGSAARRGVVAAASYEARAFGCHSAQPMSQALRRCPQAVVVPPRGRRYGEVSRAMFAILEATAPVVEPLSVDEAFLDLTGTERLLGDATEVARQLRGRIREELDLTASVGVAPNKFLAKLASDLDKPDGLVVIEEEAIESILDPLPIERMWGVGAATAERLRARGYRTFADLRRRGAAALERELGETGARLHRLACGIDERPVRPRGAAKSMGHEQTFAEDLPTPGAVRDVLLRQAEAVARRLRKAGVRARTVSVKIRYGSFETITRRETLPEPTDLTDEIWAAGRRLFDRWAGRGFRPVRLIGLTAANLVGAGRQGSLFAEASTEQRRALDGAVDVLRDRFGEDVIGRARAQRQRGD